MEKINRLKSIILVILGVLLLILGVTLGIWLSDVKKGTGYSVEKNENINVIPTQLKQNDLILYTNSEKGFSLKIPSSWKIETFEHFPDMFTIQPTESFVPESTKNSIVLSVSNNCLNTQCLTTFSLDEMVKNVGANILQKENIGEISGYKVTDANNNEAYMFLRGNRFYILSTDKYSKEMENIISTFKFL